MPLRQEKMADLRRESAENKSFIHIFSMLGEGNGAAAAFWAKGRR
jgi:hypothetical protein